jgi:arylsulfatase A-like enzyme
VEEELYHLEEDPHEQRNLVGDTKHAEQLRELRALLRQHMIDTKDPLLDGPFTRDYDPESYRRSE